jgi:hypothetical protein
MCRGCRIWIWCCDLSWGWTRTRRRERVEVAEKLGLCLAYDSSGGRPLGVGRTLQVGVWEEVPCRGELVRSLTVAVHRAGL